MKLWSKFRVLFLRNRLEREMAEEIQAHLDELTERNIAAGMSPEEARNAAMRAFGGVEQIKERARDERRFLWLEQLGQDLRYGLRQLRRAPGFFAVAILTIAVGIGMTTAFFSILYGVLLRPAAFPEPDQLLHFEETYLPENRPSAVAWGSYYQWAQRAESFSSMAAFGMPKAATTETETGPEQVSILPVTTNFFSTLGVLPVMGRDFAYAAAVPESDDVAILGYNYWQRKFSGRPDVINQTITLNDRLFTIVGVLPPHPQFDGNRLWGADVYVPAVMSVRMQEMRKGGHALVVARLKPGETTTSASAEMSVITAAMATEYPETHTGRGVKITPLLEIVLRGQFHGFWADLKPLLYALLGAAGLLLLLACINVTNLLLVRATVRQKEIVMRVALGASRSRIVRQLLGESLLLAVLGGAGGVVLGYWSLNLLKPLLTELPRVSEITLDARVLTFTGFVTALVGIGVGLVPAIRASKSTFWHDARNGERSGLSRGSRRVINGLVAMEVALACVLLYGAGILCRSFIKLHQVDLGFQSEGVYSVPLELPARRYGAALQQSQFVEQCLDRLTREAQVRLAAFTSGMPLGGALGYKVTIFGRDAGDAVEDVQSMLGASVTPDYFRTLGIPLLSGRGFTPDDKKGMPRVAVISESVANDYFPGQNPIGQRIRWGGDGYAWREIVGVVGDVKQWGPAHAFSQQAHNIYEPFAQSPMRFNLMLVVSSKAEATEIPVIIRSVLQAVDPGMPMPSLARLEDVIAASIGKYRLSFFAFSLFAGVALMLAAIGIYGVISYSVSQRTKEIGVRMALGAGAGRVVMMIVGQIGAMTALGFGVGVLGVWGGVGALRSLIFGIGAFDASSALAVVLMLVMVAFLACWLPARRAVKVDPMEALRCE